MAAAVAIAGALFATIAGFLLGRAYECRRWIRVAYAAAENEDGWQALGQVWREKSVARRRARGEP